MLVYFVINMFPSFKNSNVLSWPVASGQGNVGTTIQCVFHFGGQDSSQTGGQMTDDRTLIVF